ncbi:MAG: type II toxin-antitoxin system VapC family toxin [Holophagales bacterium]|nr:type II toxin-antitoxin system VapC family toxin [Holophagales bacterium]
MRLLLDTHALLWFLAGDEKLSGVARALVEDDGNEVLVSAGSLWEIAIKLSLGKLGMSVPFEEAFPAQLDANEIRILPILPAHLQRVVSLPFHHRDPFDRLLAAQAIAEGLPLVSRDAVFDAYGSRRLW